jgi:hypothetical protein
VIRRKVLELYKADGVDDLGAIRWPIVLSVFVVFIIVYFSLWKGVRSSGKVSESNQFPLSVLSNYVSGRMFCLSIKPIFPAHPAV